jgi:hypothetical protein
MPGRGVPGSTPKAGVTNKAFLNNHVKAIVALDFFVVPTVTYKVLFVLVILAHERRRIIHFNITEPPTAEWTAQQAVEAFPWEEAPQYLLRDRDRIYGAAFQQRVRNLGGVLRDFGDCEVTWRCKSRQNFLGHRCF